VPETRAGGSVLNLLFLLDFFYNPNAKTGLNIIILKILKIGIHFFLPVPFAGKVCLGFWYQTTGAPETGAENLSLCH